MQIIKWDIYEIETNHQITGVMFRGRVRKFCLENNCNVLVENNQEKENSVRFAIPTKEDPALINDYLNQILPGVLVKLVAQEIPNPVLSKLKVNLEERYTL